MLLALLPWVEGFCVSFCFSSNQEFQPLSSFKAGCGLSHFGRAQEKIVTGLVHLLLLPVAVPLSNRGSIKFPPRMRAL